MVVVTPRPAGFVAGKLNWRVLEMGAGEWLQVQEHRGKRANVVRRAWDGDYAKAFRILATDPQHHILAVADTQDEIEDDLAFIQANYEQHLITFFPRGSTNAPPLLDATGAEVSDGKVAKRPPRDKTIALEFLVLAAHAGARKQENALRHSVVSAAGGAAAAGAAATGAGAAGAAAGDGDNATGAGGAEAGASDEAETGRLRGELYKQGQGPAGLVLKKRFFVQKGTKLFYFASDQDTHTKGTIDLLSVDEVERHDKDLVLVTESRRWHLQALSVDAASRWEEGLKHTIAGGIFTSTFDAHGRNSKDLAGLGFAECPDGAFTDDNLAVLFLHNNLLTSIPAAISTLGRLTELYLTNNRLTELCPELFQLVHLRELHLGHNLITELPDDVGKLTELTTLNLAFNRLRDLPTALTDLGELTTLLLHGNELTHLPKFTGPLAFVTAHYNSALGPPALRTAAEARSPAGLRDALKALQ